MYKTFFPTFLIIISVGIPEFFWFGYEGENAVLVMELLGLSIDDLFNQYNNKFSIKTVLMLAIEMVILNSSSPLFLYFLVK